MSEQILVKHLSPLTFQNLTTPSYTSPSIQDVIFFPQMRPEGRQKAEGSRLQVYIDLGIPEEWVPVLMELGFDSIAKLAEVVKHTKLHQEMMGYRKKNKLEIGTVTPEEVA